MNLKKIIDKDITTDNRKKDDDLKGKINKLFSGILIAGYITICVCTTNYLTNVLSFNYKMLKLDWEFYSVTRNTDNLFESTNRFIKENKTDNYTDEELQKIWEEHIVY